MLNVVATAIRDARWFLSVSLSAVAFVASLPSIALVAVAALVMPREYAPSDRPAEQASPPPG